MADKPSEKPSIWQPFSDIVGGQRDEGFVNLSNQMSTKVDKPTGAISGSILLFNGSTGKYEVDKAPFATSVTASSTTVTSSTADVTGLSIALTYAGNYLLLCTLDLFHSVASNATVITSYATTAGTLTYTQGILRCDSSIARATVSMPGSLLVPAGGATVKVQVIKTPNVGTSSVETQTTFTALYLGKY